MNWLKNELTAPDDACARVRQWMLMQMNGQRMPKAGVAPQQLGCPQLLPGLSARPVWTAEQLPWLAHVKAAFPAIKAELLALRGGGSGLGGGGGVGGVGGGGGASDHRSGFQPYRAPSRAEQSSSENAADGVGSVGTDRGEWNIFYLSLHNLDFKANVARCPATMELIGGGGGVPNDYHHAFFSALAPGTHVTPHHGPTNKKLRCHLPLCVPPGAGCCRLRVADQVVEVKEGEPFVFDDSFEHEAWNEHPEHARIVLIFDVWHPDLTPKEVKFLGFLQNAMMRAGKRLSEAVRDGGAQTEGGDDFFSVIDAAREVMVDESKVWSMQAEFNSG